MEQSPSCVANSHSASQVSQISQNPKVHYRLHKGTPRIQMLCVTFQNKMLYFHGEELLPIAQPSIWRTTPCRLSATAYSIYLQLPSISGGCLLCQISEMCLHSKLFYTKLKLTVLDISLLHVCKISAQFRIICSQNLDCALHSGTSVFC